MKMIKNNTVPMSESIIWRQIQEYYKKLGPLAWQNCIVPYQITSNKIIAHLYVNLINAAILDNYKIDDSKNAIKKSIADKEPIYILELGAGHGKFSFYLCKLLDLFGLFTKYNIVYIASDISMKNIEYWQNHVQFKPYIENKQLDFACFDASKDKQICLINSNIIIKEFSLQNNLIVIANYIFDTLTHDAFKIKNHKLFASSLNLNYKDKFCLQKIKYKYLHKLINAENYYKGSKFNKILLDYQKKLKYGSFLFPVGALQAIDNVKNFSKKQTIILVADKGNVDINDFKTKDDPGIALHGSASFMVNFDAINRFLVLNKGYSIINPNSYNDLQIACLVNNTTNANANANANANITNKYNNSFNPNFNINNGLLEFLAKQVLYDINPLHLINLCYYKDRVNNLNNLKQILAILVISKWDPDLFFDLSQQLLKFLTKELKNGNLDLEQERDLEQGLELIAQYYFKLDKEQDIFFVIANIYYTLEKFDLAINYFKLSILNFEPTVEVWYNLSLCYYAKNNKRLVRKYLLQALNLNNRYLAAKKLLIEVN